MLFFREGFLPDNANQIIDVAVFIFLAIWHCAPLS